MTLAVLAALVSAVLACGTAMAASWKPGNRGKNKGKGMSRAKPSSARRPSAPAPPKHRQQGTDGELGIAGVPRPAGGRGEGGGKTGRRPAVPSGNTYLPSGWPEWKFPEMIPSLEKQRLFAEHLTKSDSMLVAAEAWDCLRALGLLLLGPGDPRVWAALARSARALACHQPETFRPGSQLHELMLDYFSRAVILAAGAAEALRDPALRLPPASEPGPRPSGGHAGTGDAGGASGETCGTSPDREDVVTPAEAAGPEWDRAGELASAEETLGRLRVKAPPADGPLSATARSFYGAMFPGSSPEAGKGCLPSTGDLRARLDAAEGPGGPGPGSREALVLRSLLGAEIWDTGDWSRAGEALELLKEASRGLDLLAGKRDPDSLDARERRARRLGGLYGHAAVIPRIPKVPPASHVRKAEKLFRNLEELAPSGRKGDSLRFRAACCANGMAARDIGSEGGQQKVQKFLAVYRNMLTEEAGCPHELETARRDFDVAEFLMHPESDYHMVIPFVMNSLTSRRRLLGGRHPETAASLARTGDVLFSADDPERACSFWALALEALEGQGDRCEIFRADIETRIAVHLHSVGNLENVTQLLVRACGRLSKALGDTAQINLETSFILGTDLFKAGRLDEAEEIFTKLVSLLDGAPPRSDPDPSYPSDAAVLYSSLAGKAAAMLFRGDGTGREALMRHPVFTPSRAESESGSDSRMRNSGDLFRHNFLKL
jgi:tetratricopeptide (TPR) repeat protein